MGPENVLFFGFREDLLKRKRMYILVQIVKHGL